MNLNRFFERFHVFYFYVTDMEQALAFYEGQLGFKRVHVSESLRWAEVSFGDHQRPHLGLNHYTPEEGELRRNVGGVPSFQVQDLEEMNALQAALERRDIPHKGIVDYDAYMQFLWIYDPDGNRIEFFRLKQGRLP